MKTVVGTCGRCGGPVSRDTIVWMVGTPPPPKCERCGAIPVNAYGPTLPMEAPRTQPLTGNLDVSRVDFTRLTGGGVRG